MSEPYRTTRMVEFRDTDMAGIMHFASFFGYMESAEHELIRSLGFSVHDYVEDGAISFPRVSASCDYVSPALCEQILDIAIRVVRIGNKSVTYEFQFHHEKRLVANGSITCVCCLVQAGAMPTSMELPADIVEKLSRFVA
jgi:acyl-CoA thioester hydrolase